MFQIIILLLWLTTTESVAEYPVAKPGCQATCGNIDIPYPFGIGSNCSIADSFAVTCNDSFNPHKPFINSINLEVLQISLENWTVQVNNPVITADCSGRANGREVNLTGTSFSFSATYNRFTATGCNNLALITHQATIITGCMSICNFNFSWEAGCYGINCCQTTIPYSLSFINASLRSLDPNSNQDDGCKYAFMVDYKWFSDKDIIATRDMEYVPAVLDLVYNGTCNANASFCGTNAYCLNNASTSWSSQCFCKTGYEGNPYLPSGCRDIDECSDPNVNWCGGANCWNFAGDYDCTCPDGYRLTYDWRSNGSRLSSGYNCDLANDSNSRTKVIIASTCSGLGVLLLLICSWLLWREVNKRKEVWGCFLPE